jgi:hypothetical protein
VIVDDVATSGSTLANLRGWIEHQGAHVPKFDVWSAGEVIACGIGYVASAVQECLGPALVELRRGYPELKIKMLDQTLAELIAGCHSRNTPK